MSKLSLTVAIVCSTIVSFDGTNYGPGEIEINRETAKRLIAAKPDSVHYKNQADMPAADEATQMTVDHARAAMDGMSWPDLMRYLDNREDKPKGWGEAPKPLTATLGAKGPEIQTTAPETPITDDPATNPIALADKSGMVAQIMGQGRELVMTQLGERNVTVPEGMTDLGQLAELLAKSAGYLKGGDAGGADQGGGAPAVAVTSDLPEDFPARDVLIAKGFTTLAAVKAHDFAKVKVEGIGAGYQARIKAAIDLGG